jgi:hypothetical protein
LFEDGFEVFDNLLGKSIENGKIVGFLQRFVSARRVEIRKDPFILFQRHDMKRAQPHSTNPVSRGFTLNIDVEILFEGSTSPS